jgi:DNA polymerase III gamma/tau subunit
MSGPVKVILLDEIHSATTQAMQAMLKMLEDAPKKTFFFLATTNPEKLLAAVKTRCTTINMKSLPSNVAYALVKDISEKENVDMPPSILKAISKACGGSAREAVKLLDQVIDVESEEDAIDLIEKTISCDTSTRELCQALMQNQPWKVLSGILKNIDSDAESARRSILGYFTKVLLDKGDIASAMILEMFAENYYDSGKSGLVLSCYSVYQELNRQ